MLAINLVAGIQPCFISAFCNSLESDCATGIGIYSNILGDYMKLLGISGSLRSASLNTALLKTAGKAFAPDTFTLADLNIPLYNGDMEAQDGLPKAAQLLVAQIKAADAVMIATPEYNKGISGVLKNALDWVSRAEVKPWAGKPVAIMSATAGRSGGERAQCSLRLSLQPFHPRLLQGPEVLIGAAFEAFKDGTLQNERYEQAVAHLMQALRDEAKRAT